MLKYAIEFVKSALQ